MKPIRVICACAVVALALSALASTAGASVYRVGAESATITGTQTEGQHRFFAASGELNCNESPFSASMLDGDLAPFHPTYSDATCGSASVKYNGCSFVFHPGRPISAGKWSGKARIEDAAGKSCGPGIVIKDWPSGSCEITIPEQDISGVNTVTFEEVKSEPLSVRIGFNLDLVANSKAGCGGSTFTLAYTGSWTVTAKSSGTPTSIYVESPPEWGEPSGPLDTFESEFAESGNQLLGEQGSGEDKFRVNLPVVGTLTCATARFDGSTPGGEALTASGQHEECSSADPFGHFFESTVQTNGCEYEFNASGTLDVSCPGGKAIEISVFNYAAMKPEMCVYKIEAQNGIGSISYANFGSGATQGVEATLKEGGKALAVKRIGGKFIACGAESSTTLPRGKVSFEATNDLDEAIGLRIG